MDTLSNIAKLTPKKRQKLIKEAYSVVNDRVKEKEEDIKYTSPLFDYWKLPEEERTCLLYTSPSPRDRSLSRMPSSA